MISKFRQSLLSPGFIAQYMSLDGNFDRGHPLHYNKHGICRSKLVFEQLPGGFLYQVLGKIPKFGLFLG
jgi:hypothetical protein